MVDFSPNSGTIKSVLQLHAHHRAQTERVDTLEKDIINITSWDIEGLTEAGFEGFVPIGELMKDFSQIPFWEGVFMVLNTSGEPEFLETGTGGIFLNYDPNEDVEVLKEKWIPEASVIFIGSTDLFRSNHALVDAIKWFVTFGQGIGTHNLRGRQIWQIKHSKELLICWRRVREGDPEEIKEDLIDDFFDTYEQLPFANVGETEPFCFFTNKDIVYLKAAPVVS